MRLGCKTMKELQTTLPLGVLHRRADHVSIHRSLIPGSLRSRYMTVQSTYRLLRLMDTTL
jgi:hypothetical protein